ncbi:hypothetical protein KP1_p070 (plasmid) [Klebsiella pneumoniae subsp. pneumoniae NTUH-K2044]|uniref:Uncharacterized protein n=3 Tax=Klebsiella pneumoniae TaxID=573 RepID=A0A5Q2DS98_KLEPN|nr:hypothetical protein LV202 [Klebsiella pneumoniae CG43]QGF03448.1 hypothetical protein pVir-SCNJ1-203 [Klebsiella pneumoniae subsp. pneumoniae]QIK04147.1 hypothetical protein [Klebsiella pneumoniae]WMW26740.1 hypothetical protein [Escherichia coli]BAH65987.1 hypothetical protein KP1_p070 [Klebsiella pneumoniae subsp. pneumoniae NTUH-K2044]
MYDIGHSPARFTKVIWCGKAERFTRKSNIVDRQDITYGQLM